MYRNEKNYVLLHAQLLDGTEGMEIQPDRAIYVRGSKIVKITDSASPKAGYTPIDLHGAYVLPGLINMHVHLRVGASRAKSRPTPKNS